MGGVAEVELLVEAEDFDDYGGWLLDAQFDHEMGSPYLLAHGYGRPVADASTTVQIPEAATYEVWVRCKDWVPSPPRPFQAFAWRKHPGPRVRGERARLELGTGRIRRARRAPLTVTLHDLTGFDGRCDAIYLSSNGQQPIDGAGPDARAWRRRLRGIPDEATG